jgi:hypothetical protein
MQKNYVKANAIGYIQKVNAIQPGHYVEKGQLMFVIKTKEAQSIGNTINVLDTTFHFSGINRIRASRSGYVTDLAAPGGRLRAGWRATGHHQRSGRVSPL